MKVYGTRLEPGTAVGAMGACHASNATILTGNQPGIIDLQPGSRRSTAPDTTLFEPPKQVFDEVLHL